MATAARAICWERVRGPAGPRRPDFLRRLFLRRMAKEPEASLAVSSISEQLVLAAEACSERSGGLGIVLTPNASGSRSNCRGQATSHHLLHALQKRGLLLHLS